MDEPLGALDKQLREQMQFEIKHIHESLDVTVIYVTHDQGEALTMSNRIAVFNDGVIQQLAPPGDLYEKPENAFVAQFIGENNVLFGNVRHISNGQCDVEVRDGNVVKAKVVNIEGVGSPTTLSLRPERVTVNPESGTCENMVEASVEEVIYLGDHVRTRVSLCGHDDFVIKIPNSHARVDLDYGDKISVGWQAEDCRALDAVA